MADPNSTQNPLVIPSKTSEQSVQLHPLVLLTISDYTTRHTLRQQKGPIVGAILGAQHGRDITMEHAFECKVISTSTSNASDPDTQDAWIIDAEWFADRLQQFRDVHKAAALDLVGWFTLAPLEGPQAKHLPIHRQLSEAYNESLLFLAFHPAAIAGGAQASSGDKLPVTIYEPVLETGADEAGADTSMHGSAANGETAATILRFRELPHCIETGDAEMIGVDFVARGGANATAIQSTPAQPTSSTIKTPTTSQPTEKSKGKAKAKAVSTPSAANDETSPTPDLTPEEEDLIASMTAKANAIRMLKQRVALIKAYLASLPPCYLNDAAVEGCESHERVSHPVLRAIAALLARLPLLIPFTPAAIPAAKSQDNTQSERKTKQPLSTSVPASVYTTESAAQATDVALISLLGTLGSTLQAAHNMGTKAALVEGANQGSRRDGMSGGGFGPWYAGGTGGGGGVFDEAVAAPYS